MSLTVQKLQLRVPELGKAAVGRGISISPILMAAAFAPLSPLPEIGGSLWRRLDLGQPWGGEYSTTWLTASLQVPEARANQSKVLRLRWETMPRDALSPWDTGPRDALLLQLEATLFLDGSAIGGFDARHHTLVLPPDACDGLPHDLVMRAYTRTSAPFGGLTVHTRDERTWQLYQLMHTLLAAHLALDKHTLAHHTLLERLNTAYTMLDLREGWHSERLAESAQIGRAHV